MIPPFDLDGNPTRFLGFGMSQNRFSMPAWSYFFERVKVAQIVEIGTSIGGMTCALGIIAKNMGAELYTCDIAEKAPEHWEDWFSFLGIEYLAGDVFETARRAEIDAIIGHPGISVVLCDGGNKVREFIAFSEALKPGDYLAAHDWHFDSDWPWREIQYADVAEVRANLGLEEVHQGTFERTGWRIFQRATA